MVSLDAYKPLKFFAIVFGLLALFSVILTKPQLIPGHPELQFLVLMLLGLLTPFVTTLIMIYGSQNSQLQKDFKCRLSFYSVKLALLPHVLLLAFVALGLALVTSLILGQSASQLTLAPSFSLLNILITLILSPLLEEIGWRGYGIDSLRARFNLFQTSILFTALWGLWHVPAFFIPGSYQYSLLSLSKLYIANFFVSLFPTTLIMNWFYFKSNRSILIAMLFHSSLNLAATVLQITQFTKCLMTIWLFIFAIFIIVSDRKFFFNR